MVRKMKVSAQYIELWFFKFITFFLGCYLCFLLQSQFQMSTVLAAALTGFLGTIIPETKRIDAVHVHANIYMGAFVAMGSRVVDAGTLQILLVSLIGSAVYFVMSPFFKGFGGKLGLIAFISSILGLALRHWL